jgi:hypothetical protein
MPDYRRSAAHQKPSRRRLNVLIGPGLEPLLIAVELQHRQVTSLPIDRGYLRDDLIPTSDVAGAAIICRPWPTPARAGPFRAPRLLHELREEPELPQVALLARLHPVNLVLAEDWKTGEPHDSTIIAVASEPPLDPATTAGPACRPSRWPTWKASLDSWRSSPIF